VLQVNTFLQTIAAQPPVISLGGYVTINRQLLIGVSRHFSAERDERRESDNEIKV
jgi:hypothetical protein